MSELQHDNAREDRNEFNPIPFLDNIDLVPRGSSSDDEQRSQIMAYLLRLIQERKDAERKLPRASSGLRFESRIYSNSRVG